jgi:hypothetical protein
MTTTNIAFPFSICYSVPPNDDQILSFRPVDINNSPMFNPLTYESTIPYPTNNVIPENRFNPLPRGFLYNDPSKLDLPC